MTADPRARWAELLRAPADAPADVAASAFVRALPGRGFLPAPEQVAAVNALTGSALPTGRDENVDRLLRDEVEAFARSFWTQTPGERLVAWAELSRRGAEPARLRELEPGLDVTAPSLADPVAEELAELFRALFVLPSRARAIRRNGWLLEHAADAERWRTALAVVQHDAPALAALEPQLRAALAPGFDLSAFVEGATATVARSSAGVVHFRSAERVRAAARQAEADRGYDYEAADGARARKILLGSPVFLFFVFCACSGFVRLASRDNAVRDNAAKPLPSYSPSYTPGSSAQPYPSPGERPVPTTPTFTAAEVAAFQQYERDKAAGGNVREPLGYSAWRLVDRPDGQPDPARTPIPNTKVRLVYLSDVQIRICQLYDTARNGPPPDRYEDWVKAGRPTAAGFARVPNNP